MRSSWQLHKTEVIDVARESWCDLMKSRFVLKSPVSMMMDGRGVSLVEGRTDGTDVARESWCDLRGHDAFWRALTPVMLDGRGVSCIGSWWSEDWRRKTIYGSHETGRVWRRALEHRSKNCTVFRSSWNQSWQYTALQEPPRRSS
jgi:hypothetical protein